jgi:hypothetical protein
MEVTRNKYGVFEVDGQEFEMRRHLKVLWVCLNRR